MFRVGLTGGIGSGKSTVADLFAKQGVSIIDTDLIAHQITQPDGPAYQSIINTFGSDILSTDGTIDRKKLASIVFHSKEKKNLLESLLHPLIWVTVEQQVTLSESPYCIIVVPLLFEGKHQDRFNSTLLVHCPKEEQIKRVTKRDHRTADDIRAIMKNQISTDKKLEFSDRKINNTGSIDSLENEVKRLHKIYLDESSKFTQE